MKRIRKDDLVRVTAGKDKGKDGRVLRVLTDRDKVVVEGRNMVTKHLRPQTSAINPDGGRVRMEAPIHLSNVMPICPGCDAAVRVGYELLHDVSGRTNLGGGDQAFNPDSRAPGSPRGLRGTRERS